MLICIFCFWSLYIENQILSEFIFWIRRIRMGKSWMTGPISSTYRCLRNHSPQWEKIFFGSETTFSWTQYWHYCQILCLWTPCARKDNLVSRNTLFIYNTIHFYRSFLCCYHNLVMLACDYIQGTLIVFGRFLKL